MHVCWGGYQYAYATTLNLGKEFTVPKDSYFVLNDNRNELLDSRNFGPVTRAEFAGRPFLAFAWPCPRLLH